MEEKEFFTSATYVDHKKFHDQYDGLILTIFKKDKLLVLKGEEIKAVVNALKEVMDLK